jgi:hypothetical protein
VELVPVIVVSPVVNFFSVFISLELGDRLISRLPPYEYTSSG